MTIENPYSSPISKLAAPQQSASKPVSWWIMQIIMVPAVPLLLFYGASMGLYATGHTRGGDGGFGIAVFAIMCALALWALGMAVTAYRRMPVVRWLGGAFIALLILSGVQTFMSIFSQGGAYTAYRLGQFFGAGLVIALEIFWLYSFAFSPKARRYMRLDQA